MIGTQGQLNGTQGWMNLQCCCSGILTAAKLFQVHNLQEVFPLDPEGSFRVDPAAPLMIVG